MYILIHTVHLRYIISYENMNMNMYMNMNMHIQMKMNMIDKEQRTLPSQCIVYVNTSLVTLPEKQRAM